MPFLVCFIRLTVVHTLQHAQLLDIRTNGYRAVLMLIGS